MIYMETMTGWICEKIALSKEYLEGLNSDSICPRGYRGEVVCLFFEEGPVLLLPYKTFQSEFTFIGDL